MTSRVAASVVVSTEPETAFAALVDLRSQEKWIIATRLYPIDGAISVPHVGARLAAFSGVGSIGFLDTMTVTEYDPPFRWVMDKDGDLLRGVGILQVEPLSIGCRVTWANELILPLGIIGRIGWLFVRPAARLAMRASLGRLAKQLRTGELPLTTMTPPASERRLTNGTTRADGTESRNGTTRAEGTAPPDGTTRAEGTAPPDGTTWAEGTAPPDGTASPDGTAPPLGTASPDRRAPDRSPLPGRTAAPT